MVRVAEASGASGFTDASMAHIGSCFYTGQVGVDFAAFLLAGGGHVAVPTMTNVSLIDALHPELRPERSDPEVVRGAMRLMEIYEALGCDVVWTCAPYQQNIRPGLGDQIVASESNAVAFYNSVCGARTNKYGDFVDICAAITGRVPTSGLHTDEGRRGRVLFRISNVSPDLMKEDVFHQVLGSSLTAPQTPALDSNARILARTVQQVRHRGMRLLLLQKFIIQVWFAGLF